MKRAQVKGEEVGQCVFGNVIHTEPKDMYLSRVAALNGGVPKETPALTVNRLCGSGLQAIVSRGAVHPAGRRRHRRRRRRGKHEPAAFIRPPSAGARAWATSDVDMMVGALHDPFDSDAHGHHRREHRREVGHHARAAGRVRGRKPPPRRARDRRKATSRSQIVPVELKSRKGAMMFDTDEHVARRRDARRHGEAEAGVREGRRHRHRGQRVGHQRRRRGGGADGAQRRREARR